MGKSTGHSVRQNKEIYRTVANLTGHVRRSDEFREVWFVDYRKINSLACELTIEKSIDWPL